MPVLASPGQQSDRIKWSCHSVDSSSSGPSGQWFGTKANVNMCFTSTVITVTPNESKMDSASRVYIAKENMPR